MGGEGRDSWMNGFIQNPPPALAWRRFEGLWIRGKNFGSTHRRPWPRSAAEKVITSSDTHYLAQVVGMQNR